MKLSLLTRAILLIGMIALAGCGLFGGAEAVPTVVVPTPGAAAPITITAPVSGNVSSPITVQGRVAAVPFEGTLNYRLFALDGTLLASGAFQVPGEQGQPAEFRVQIPYTVSAPGLGRIEIVQISPVDGSVAAIASVQVNLTPGGGPAPTATATPPPAGSQQIIIETPPPGTEVGSPVVITGRTARPPAGNKLSYRVRDAAGAVLGSGEFPTADQGGVSVFTASFGFTLPPGGGDINIEIFEPGPNNQVVASAGLRLTVAPPQAITIETPAPNVVVGSPVVLTGRTARLPFQGTLAYKITDAGGRQIGQGFFPVQGQPGGPALFNASLEFTLPPGGGKIRVELLDQDSATNQVAARAAIELNVAPPPQSIIIETPPPGTLVGSPVVLTGRTARFPAGGQLSYRVRDAAGNVIGNGSFGVVGAQDGPATFNASLRFTPPAAGGAISIELLEVNATNNQVIASTSIPLTVAGPTPTVGPTSTPRPTPTGSVPPVTQAITIDTPRPGAVATNPLTITGQVALYPAQGNLSYRLRDSANAVLAEGEFLVGGVPGATRLPWSASLQFTPPAQADTLTLEVFDVDPATGTVLASASVQLQGRPGAAAPPRPTAPAAVTSGQTIVIESPAPDTQVGSPVVLTGRVARYPSGGKLVYRVLLPNGQVIGTGEFQVAGQPGQANLPFTAALTFAEPAGGGPITVELIDRDETLGTIIASASVQLRV